MPLLIPKAGVRWEGALILSIIYLTFFLWQAWILRGKPTTALGLPALLRVIPLVQTSVILLEKLVSFLFYLLFVGPSEEFLFRSYIQSRLNAAFDRCFSFWGVPFSWGLVITALIYGLMHVLNLFNSFLGKFEFYIWWGVWTVFGGISFGYIREKAGTAFRPHPFCMGYRRRSHPYFWAFSLYAEECVQNTMCPIVNLNFRDLKDSHMDMAMLDGDFL